MDNQFDPAQYASLKDLGIAIGQANEAMMRQADIIIANAQPWRGPEADDGTAYEIGFMAAQGKLVVLHTTSMDSFAERVIRDVYHGKVHRDGPFTRGDSDNMMIESFPGFADNLMLVNAATRSIEKATGRKPDPATVVQRSFEDAATLARNLWAESHHPKRTPISCLTQAFKKAFGPKKQQNSIPKTNPPKPA